jgi:5-oxoprolinase (ATP-hydrolysing) subunit A
LRKVDLNVDVGEGFPFDEDLLVVATSANVCCGAHAGSPVLSRTTVEHCLAQRVRVGAHPGIPDRASMGRGRLPPLTGHWLASLRESVTLQVDLLAGLGARYVKPHGTLYNASADSHEIAGILSGVVKQFGLPLMGLADSLHEEAARSAGVPLIREAFADRAYEGHRLVPRSEPGAVLTDVDELSRNAVGLALRADSVCVHGDTPGCVEIAKAVRLALEADGFEVGI